MNNHNVLNGRGCRHVQSHLSPFFSNTCNTAGSINVAALQHTSNEGLTSFALILTLGDLLNRAVQCGKTAIHSGLVSLLIQTELLFKVLSNQNFSQASSNKDMLGVGRKLRVLSTPIVAAFEKGFSCVLTTSTDR